MKKNYLIMAFVLLLLIVLLFSFDPKKIVNSPYFSSTKKSNQCVFQSVILTDLSGVNCEYLLISYSDSNKFSQNGFYSLSGAKWFNGDKIDLLSGENINPKFIFKNFFDPSFKTNSIIVFDETGGSKAGLFTFIARDFGLKNFYFLDGDKLSKSLSLNKAITESFGPSDNWTGDFDGKFDNGTIGKGRFKVVFAISGLNLDNDDLFLYSTDGGMMKSDEFYIQNKDKLNIKNLYWPFLKEFNGDVKTKDGVQKELEKSGIDLSKYKNIYIYYPIERRKSGIEALILQNYFAN